MDALFTAFIHTLYILLAIGLVAVVLAAWSSPDNL